MQPDPGPLREASGGVLSCVHQPVHVLYVKDGGQVGVLLSAVRPGLRPGQSAADEVVLRRKAVGDSTQTCGWRTVAFISLHQWFRVLKDGSRDVVIINNRI